MKDQVVLVTGASRGIGHAIALELARQGMRVAGTATTAAGADKISQTFASLGLSGQGFVLNIADEQSVSDCLTQVEQALGAPLILVNNAGITRDQLLLRMKLEDWEAVIHTNLTGVFRLTQLCLKPMVKARFGRIISIGSVVGSIGNPGQCNYAAAKAGLIGFTKSLAYEVASRGITANLIAPGFIESDMTQVLTEQQKTQILNKVPLGRLGQPEEIAKACVFLISSSYITGHTLHVNGGMYMN